MTLQIPNLSLILLIGPSGCGKSTFAAKHFLSTEVISSDQCRGIVSDDENSQAATADAFELLEYIARKRLTHGLRTVIDATNVQPEARKKLLRLAREFHVFAVAIVFLISEEICRQRNESRPDRQFGSHVIRNQHRSMRMSLRGLQKEGFRFVHVLRSPDEVDATELERQRSWNDKREEHGPFDIVGDVHGCFGELSQLLESLGYSIERLAEPVERERGRKRYFNVSHPENRRVIFLGDLVDRGPDSPSVLKLAMSMVGDGTALCVPGNHDVKLSRKLHGSEVHIAHGLQETLDQLAKEPDEFGSEVAEFLTDLVSHFVLDDGRLVVAHAGLKQEMQGRASGAVREFALYGETTGEIDEFGLPVRLDWAAGYRGSAMVVYGHTPVAEPEWFNNTINIDTGCVFGHQLTALRYPEREIWQVPARETYAGSPKPLIGAEPPGLTAQQRMDEVLDLEDFIGKRIVHTSLKGNITIREENAVAALEAMSRFAVSPKWLVYLPPTMSPTETTLQPGLLEHPAEGFAYFASHGVTRVMCEEKHMGSRAVAIVCKDPSVPKRRFGIQEEGLGVVYTRTGRRFFQSAELEQELLARVASAFDRNGLWDELKTDWAVLDCELMPWSAKAQDLLRRQYAPVAASGIAATQAALEAISNAAAILDLPEMADLRAVAEDRATNAKLYADAYRRYCWPVSGIEDYRLAPFHLMATEGAVHIDKDHGWHMDTLARLCSGDAVLLPTPCLLVDTTDTESMSTGIEWWEAMTAKGGEGMVIKPFSFLARSGNGLVQPGVKCRGREYLRIIYGPEYTAPENLTRLRRRGLGVKRSMAQREFALGVEALERFVRGEPLRRIHECVFGVLALESEPVDPRL